MRQNLTIDHKRSINLIFSAIVLSHFFRRKTMPVISFFQIGGTVHKGTPALLKPLKGAEIPFVYGFSYFTVKDAESRTRPLYDPHSPTTIVMVNEGSLKAYAEGYAAYVKDKTIILFASTKTSRDFNLGIAVFASFGLMRGIYIVRRGKVMDWQQYIP